MSDWRDKAPGIERAKAVMRPTTPHTHADYVRAAHNDGSGLYTLTGTHIPFAVDDAFGFVTFAADDSFPDTRIISADRVEAAVETAAFLAICGEEGLHAAFWGDHWIVSATDAGAPIGSAQTLRGAYVAYHSQCKAAPDAARTGFWPEHDCDNCRHVEDSALSDPCCGCIAGAFDGWEAEDE